jgi:hypothetical protein
MAEAVESHKWLKMSDLKTYLDRNVELLLRFTDGTKIPIFVIKKKIHVSYVYRDEKDTITIDVAWTPCHYGGQRPWLVCPACERRCVALSVSYIPACRKCYNLVYSSSKNSSRHYMADLENKLQTVGKRLGRKSSGSLEGVPMKPKWMRNTTYQLLAFQYQCIASAINAAFVNQLTRKFPRITI